MRTWINKINIKQHLDSDKPLEEVKEGVIKELNKLIVFPKRLIYSLKRTKSVESFDKVLDKIYDYADAHSIWLGL